MRVHTKLKLGRVLPLLLCLLLLWTGCVNDTRFSRTITQDRYFLKLMPLNDTMTESYSLKAGDAIAVTMEIESGKLDVWIAGENGDILYQGNGVQSGAFELVVSVDGTYTITVTGEQGRGTLNFEMIRGETK